MTTPRDPRHKLRALMDSLAEEVATISDEALREDAQAEGVDATREAARVREVLLAGLLGERVNRVKRAFESRERAARAPKESNIALPSDAKARRQLMDRVLDRRPQMCEALTMPFRDFASISDSDVEVVLQEMQHLGLLDDDDLKKE